MKERPLSLSSSPRIKRREVLGFIGGATVVSLVGCQRQTAAESAEVSTPASSTQTVADTAQAIPACVVSPEQTEGPYFVEEALNRSDVREGKAGVPLRLVLRVSQVSSGACMPLEGAVVDIWHCDAEGVYSDVGDGAASPRENRSFSTVGQTFLRGSQVTDENGTVEFTTIYPGWYRGRTVHTHFKIRSDAAAQQGYEFTSQLYFDDALSDQVFTQAPYNSRGQRDVQNEGDRIYQDSGDQLMLQLTPGDQRYTGIFNIGLEIA